MGFKMKGPGLPGFRKNAGSGFYKGSGFNINTSNRSPMKEGEDDNPNKHDASLQSAWNSMDPAEKAKWEAKGGWTKWSNWQYDEIRKIEYRTKTGEFTEEGGGGSGGTTRKTHFGMDDACSAEYIAMNGSSECEKVTTIINERSNTSTSNFQQEETRKKENNIAYTNKTLSFESAKGKSADDGTGMITVYDGLTAATSDYVGTMSQAEFYAKYVGDGDLKVQTKKTGNDRYENATGKLYMSQSFFDTQYTPMIDHKKQNRENRIEFEAESRKNGMNPEEITARLENDPSLRLDVAGVHGFNKPIYGSGKLNSVMMDDNAYLEQQTGLNFQNKKRNIDAAHKIDPLNVGTSNTRNSVMPFNPNDYTIDEDGNASVVEGSSVPNTDDWIFNMNERDKREIVANDDSFDYHFGVGVVDKDGNVPSSKHRSGTSKDFFNKLYDNQSKKLDFSKLDQDENGDYMIQGKVIGNKTQVMKQMGLSGLSRDLGASILEQFSSDLYSEEVKTDLHPEGETTKAIDNRVYDKGKGMYVDIDPRLNPDGTERLSAYNVTDRDVTDPTQKTNLQREEEEEE